MSKKSCIVHYRVTNKNGHQYDGAMVAMNETNDRDIMAKVEKQVAERTDTHLVRVLSIERDKNEANN